MKAVAIEGRAMVMDDPDYLAELAKVKRVKDERAALQQRIRETEAARAAAIHRGDAENIAELTDRLYRGEAIEDPKVRDFTTEIERLTLQDKALFGVLQRRIADARPSLTRAVRKMLPAARNDHERACQRLAAALLELEAATREEMSVHEMYVYQEPGEAGWSQLAALPQTQVWPYPYQQLVERCLKDWRDAGYDVPDWKRLHWRHPARQAVAAD